MVGPSGPTQNRPAGGWFGPVDRPNPRQSRGLVEGGGDHTSHFRVVVYSSPDYRSAPVDSGSHSRIVCALRFPSVEIFTVAAQGRCSFNFAVNPAALGTNAAERARLVQHISSLSSSCLVCCMSGVLPGECWEGRRPCLSLTCIHPSGGWCDCCHMSGWPRRGWWTGSSSLLQETCLPCPRASKLSPARGP